MYESGKGNKNVFCSASAVEISAALISSYDPNRLKAAGVRTTLVRRVPHAQSSEVCLAAETNNQKLSKHNKERILSLKYLLWPSHSYIPGPHVLLLCFATYMEICQVQISGQLQNCSTGSWLVITHTYSINLQLQLHQSVSSARSQEEHVPLI